MNPFKDPEKWSLRPVTVYELTICPDDVKQFVDKKDTRLRNCVEYYKELIKDVPAMFHFFAEVSHPQHGDANTCRIARIHWHGVICFKNEEEITNFLLSHWHRFTQHARIQFNEYRPDVWPDYCRKQKAYLPNWTRLKNAGWADVVALGVKTADVTETPPPVDLLSNEYIDDKAPEAPHLNEVPKKGTKRPSRPRKGRKTKAEQVDPFL